MIGYGFAISKNEAIVAEGAGGFARLGQDDPTSSNKALPFNVTTQTDTASAAKLVDRNARRGGLHSARGRSG